MIKDRFPWESFREIKWSPAEIRVGKYTTFQEERSIWAELLSEEWRLCDALARRFRIGIPAAYGFALAPFMPRAVPIDVVFGGALDVARFVDGDAPIDAQIEALREAYCGAVAALFESHKHQFGYGHKRVEWIEHRPGELASR